MFDGRESPGTGRFGVRGGDLVACADRVAAIGDRVGAAAGAGAAVRAGSDAYGKLCLMVPITLDVLQGVLVEGIEAAAESVRDTGDRLRVTAREYAGADERGAAKLGRTVTAGARRAAELGRT